MPVWSQFLAATFKGTISLRPHTSAKRPVSRIDPAQYGQAASEWHSHSSLTHADSFLTDLTEAVEACDAQSQKCPHPWSPVERMSTGEGSAFMNLLMNWGNVPLDLLSIIATNEGLPNATVDMHSDTAGPFSAPDLWPYAVRPLAERCKFDILKVLSVPGKPDVVLSLIQLVALNELPDRLFDVVDDDFESLLVSVGKRGNILSVTDTLYQMCSTSEEVLAVYIFHLARYAVVIDAKYAILSNGNRHLVLFVDEKTLYITHSYGQVTARSGSPERGIHGQTIPCFQVSLLWLSMAVSVATLKQYARSK
jgi:hypothetical protein